MSFYKIDLSVNPNPLAMALRENPGLYGRFDLRSQGDSPHREMTDIWLRTNDVEPFYAKGSMVGFADEHDSVWYQEYYRLPEAKKLIFEVMAAVNGERLGAVLITKLPPGGKIYPHTDDSWHALYYADKYYIPIENHVGATFNFEDSQIKPKLGEVYHIDNSKLHWVNNDTQYDRVAMVICVRRT